MPPRCGKASISKEMKARSKFSFASCTFNGNVSAIELEEYQIRRKGHKRKKKHRTNSRQVYYLRMHLDTSRHLRFFCPGFGVDFRKQLVAVLHSGEFFPNLDGTGRRYFNLQILNKPKHDKGQFSVRVVVVRYDPHREHPFPRSIYVHVHVGLELKKSSTNTGIVLFERAIYVALFRGV